MNSLDVEGHLRAALACENSLLGALLLKPKMLHQADEVEVDDFAHFSHRAVWQAVRTLQAAGKTVDVDAIEDQIERLGVVAAAGAAQLIVAGDPTPDGQITDAYVRAWADEVRRLARVRRAAVARDDVPPPRDEDAPPFIDHDGKPRGECIPSEVVIDLARVGQRSRKRARTWADCRREIYARKDEPWIDIRIDGTVIAECRNGSFVPLVAPSGAGKSTLALQMLVDHATHRGPAVFLTYELDGDEAVGRALGQLCSVSWGSVLRGEVPEELAPDVERLRILERDDATMENLEHEVEELRKEYLEQPVLVVVDYMQATPAPPGKERGFAANVSAELRRTAKRLRVVLIGVSQASTDNSKKLAAGDLLGIDSASTGAETAQIERDAYVILTLGHRAPIDEDTMSWKLSVAKYRMGRPDVVYELHYRGRVGHWNIVGEARKASEVRAERDAERQKLKSSGGIDTLDVMFKRLVKEHAAGKRELCTKRHLRDGNGFGKEKAELALDALVHEGRARVVEIPRVEKNGKAKVREIYEPLQGGEHDRP